MTRMEILWLIKNLEYVALALYPQKSFGQNFLEFVYAFKAIVEGYDATVACVALYVFKHLICRKAVAVVACN